ncbi:MAG: replicative DNA helicase [Chlorobi bacterium]|nr:replicative DNA helicase [Chlorobiota bacterium]
MAVQKENKESVKNINLEYGKIPPQALDLEEAVLGALMLEKDAVLTVIDILKPSSFYKESHKKIYEAILYLSNNEQAIDILTVTEQLRKNNKLEEIGGPFYITQLTGKVASSAHIEFHARIIAQKFIQRELIRISSEMQKNAFDDSIDVYDLLDFSERQLFEIAEGNIKKETLKLDTVIAQAIEQIKEAGKQEDGLSGVPSGFSGIDRITSGWQKSDLVIIAGRPSMGKTAFVLTMARNMAVDYNKSVAIFSLEMSSIQLVNRLIVSETELASEKIKNGRLENYEWEQLDYKIKKLVDAPVYIDDTPAISIFEVRAKARRLKAKNDIQLIVIDYLQLMTMGGDSRGSSREQEVSTISRSLKAIAKELNIPIVALSQLNRSVETRGGDKRPQLSDLRESGAIEQDADMVLFVHRPEYYRIDVDEDGNSLKGIAELIIAKHRNGAVGSVKLKFQSEFAKFSDLDTYLDPLGFDDDYSNGQVFKSKMNHDLLEDDENSEENTIEPF